MTRELAGPGPCTFPGVQLSGITCQVVQFYDADKAKSVLDIYANDKLFKYNNETDNMSLHFMLKIIFLFHPVEFR